MRSFFPAHSPADSAFARELSAFLETGCDIVSYVDDAAIKPGEDLFAAWEAGLSADMLTLLLSNASSPARWPRERWEALMRSAAESDTRLSIVQLEDCAFPATLRKGSNFFDATDSPAAAMRRLKRWIWGIELGTEPSMSMSADLEILYCELADRPGVLNASAAMAARFAHEAAREFEAVYWVPGYGRTLAQIAGDLGAQLAMRLDDPVTRNCERIRDLLSKRRCLVVLDAPEVPVAELIPGGRASVLFTTEPHRMVDDPATLSGARWLVSAGRFAEAHELLLRLYEEGVERESCARELAWICDHWDLVEEANEFRFHSGPAPSEQLRLF